jgi:20S proteasome subunit alpha 6
MLSFVLISFQRSPSELSGYQKKVFPIDDHIGMAMSGLTSDARSLWYAFFTFFELNNDSRFMRSECLSQKWAYAEPLPVYRLVASVASSQHASIIEI